MFGVRPPVADGSFDSCTALSDRLPGWRNAISAYGSRHNEGFSIVNNKRLERVGRALDNSLLPFDKVENIDGILSFVRRRTGEPVSTRFDKLQLVKSRPLFSPSWAFRDWFYLIDQVLLDPIGVAIPGDVHQPVVEMNRPRQPIHAYSLPIPQLEREDIWSGANFKDHTVFA